MSWTLCVIEVLLKHILEILPSMLQAPVLDMLQKRHLCILTGFETFVCKMLSIYIDEK